MNIEKVKLVGAALLVVAVIVLGAYAWFVDSHILNDIALPIFVVTFVSIIVLTFVVLVQNVLPKKK